MQRVAESLRERFVRDGRRSRSVDRAVGGVRANRPADEIDPVGTVNPRPVLFSRANGPSGAEPERREHFPAGAPPPPHDRPPPEAGAARSSRTAPPPLLFPPPTHAPAKGPPPWPPLRPHLL